MKSIQIQKTIKEVISQVSLSCIQCNIDINIDSDHLWTLIKNDISILKNTYTLETIRKIESNYATCNAYKLLGKEPSRYRPSAEALLRRIISGKELYRINIAVDLLNYVSIKTGFSIGGYDVKKIKGGIKFGIGAENETYEAIGRGVFNIHNLPVFRDEVGAFGSPCSDSVRTMVDNNTTEFLMIIINFCEVEKVKNATNKAIELLIDYAHATNIETLLVI